jgi:(2R)-sulfolactate sulfo-lyase subunit alpha
LNNGRPARYDSYHNKKTIPGFSPSHPAARAGTLQKTTGVEMIHVLVHDKKDTVGVIVVEGIKAGQELTGWVMEDDSTIQVKALNDVPIGHKLALKDIGSGETVIKYGFDIGKAVAQIRKGEHAHVHNMKTKRW